MCGWLWYQPTTRVGMPVWLVKASARAVLSATWAGLLSTRSCGKIPGGEVTRVIRRVRKLGSAAGDCSEGTKGTVGWGGKEQLWDQCQVCHHAVLPLHCLAVPRPPKAFSHNPHTLRRSARTWGTAFQM